MEKENKQHVQLPNNMTKEGILNPQDLLVYVAIKRHVNKDTKEAFPSLQRLCQLTGASINTVRKCISRLEENGHIKIEKRGRQNYYTFSQYENYEPFSYEFLDKEDLTFQEKAYIIASQQYMFKDIKGLGKISMSNKEISERINLSESTISKCNRSLSAKEYMQLIKLNVTDKDYGTAIQEKIFYLDELGQAVIWSLRNHEQRIEATEFKVDNNEKRIKSLEKDIELLKRALVEKCRENLELKGIKEEIVVD